MKIRTIICFIFSILGLLALVAYFFPEDGIAVGSVRMKFPSLTEVLQTEEEKETLPTDTVSTDTLSTEELLQMRMDALKAEKESEFMTYCETNAARIYMPGDNIDYLDPFSMRSKLHANAPSASCTTAIRSWRATVSRPSCAKRSKNGSVEVAWGWRRPYKPSRPTRCHNPYRRKGYPDTSSMAPRICGSTVRHTESWDKRPHSTGRPHSGFPRATASIFRTLPASVKSRS